jgi:uncharacterized protein (TIGR03118 family)
MSVFHRSLGVSCLALGALCMSQMVVAADSTLAYSQTNLVSDGAVSALHIDPNLKNPWGIAAAPGGAFWFSDNSSGLSTLYDGLGDVIPLVVTLPGPKGSSSSFTAAPTGIVWNPDSNLFTVGPQQAAVFIFATEDGTISAWNPAANLHTAILEVDASKRGAGAVYKGLALATNSSGVHLYATNFRAGTVDVYDSTFKSVKLKGDFTDPQIPAGYAPFGIAAIDGNLFVTYALQDAGKHDDVKGAGHGVIDVFSTEGHFIKRFATHGVLNSPWGIARAPYDFGPASTRILIGNFGDGWINSFDADGANRGPLLDPSGYPISIDGLWSITFGSESATEPNKLYFTAGPNGEADGLFGSIQVTKVAE